MPDGTSSSGGFNLDVQFGIDLETHLPEMSREKQNQASADSASPQKQKPQQQSQPITSLSFFLI
jgi:hypothetical protein